MNIDKIDELLKERNVLSKQLEEKQQELKRAGNLITQDDIKDLDYDKLHGLYHELKSLLSKDNYKMISEILYKKKIEKYPQMKKPIYYPEIDRLEISDSEKLRLDKAARYNLNYYLGEHNMERLHYKLSIEDLEMLTKIGIATKYYNFRCDECGDSAKMITEENLFKFKRVWELEKIGSQLTKEQTEELYSLYEEGFFSIILCCMEDDEFHVEISREEELENYKDNIDVIYKIKKVPDLTYEKI